MSYIFKHHAFAKSETLLDATQYDAGGGFIGPAAMEGLNRQILGTATFKSKAPEASGLRDQLADEMHRMPNSSGSSWRGLGDTTSSVASRSSLADTLRSGNSGRSIARWLPSNMPAEKPFQLVMPLFEKAEKAKPKQKSEVSAPTSNNEPSKLPELTIDDGGLPDKVVIPIIGEATITEATITEANLSKLGDGKILKNRKDSKASMRSLISRHSKETPRNSLTKPNGFAGEYFGGGQYRGLSKGSNIVVGQQSTYMKWNNCAAFSAVLPPPVSATSQVGTLACSRVMSKQKTSRMGSKSFSEVDAAKSAQAQFDAWVANMHRAIQGGLESRFSPWCAEKALALLEPDKQPSDADKKKASEERPGAPHRELIAACLVGHERIDDLIQLADAAAKDGGALKLNEWIQKQGDVNRQVVAAALAAMNATQLCLDGSLLQNANTIFLWINLQTLSLRHCSGLKEVTALRKCNYLESVDLSYSENLCTLCGLLGIATLRSTNLLGCNSVGYEEVWSLAAQLGSVDGTLVWPNRRLLDNGLRSNKKNRSVSCLVVKATRSGGQQLLTKAMAGQDSTSGIDLCSLRQALTYAEKFGVDVNPAKQLLYNTMMERLLSAEDREIIKAASGRRRVAMAKRIAAVSKWLQLCPSTGITCSDFCRFLETSGFEPPRDDPKVPAQVFHALDVEMRGVIDHAVDGLIVQRLAGGFQGPLEPSVMELVLSSLVSKFGSIDAMIDEYSEDRKGQLNFFEFKSAARMSGVHDSGKIAGAWSWLDFERKGVLSVQDSARVEHLSLLTSVNHIDTLLQFLVRKCGNYDNAWTKLDTEKSGQVIWKNMANALSKMKGSPIIPFSSLQLLFSILSEDGYGQLSKKEWAKLSSWEGAAAVFDDLRQIWEYCRTQFGASPDYLDVAFQNMFPEGEDARDKILFEEFKDALKHWGMTPQCGLKTIFTVLNRINRTNSMDVVRELRRGSALGNLDVIGGLAHQDWLSLQMFEVEERRKDVGAVLEFLRAKADAASDTGWATTWDLLVQDKQQWKAKGSNRPSRASQARASLSLRAQANEAIESSPEA
eukprot:gnl/MRDRNA2_/MRDRNA2_30602_c0_seq1.p1 gnl/MRDRNA2_/MRDRNA2_30602_c0~~gnl/MRDRNA2_/MRDRNA2_30602_c0_seq1.p1  ORF type:complete len:1061 (+),score=206.38 gnl/MRDRNA2_/MRDRNA2_30602_c0_seq1:138-3320(+)